MKHFLLTLVLCLSFITLKNTDVFASASTLVPPTDISSTLDSYVIFQKDNNYICFVYSSATSNCHAASHGVISLRAKSGVESPYGAYISSVPMSDYKNTDYNGGWGTMESFAHKYNQSFDSILYCNQDILTTDNSGIFFPKTPPLILEVEKALVGMEKKMMVDFSTLAICGVACLISLVGLVILSKKFRLFLH